MKEPRKSQGSNTVTQTASSAQTQHPAWVQWASYKVEREGNKQRLEDIKA